MHSLATSVTALVRGEAEPFPPPAPPFDPFLDEFGFGSLFAVSLAASGLTLALKVLGMCVLARTSILLWADAVVAPCKADLRSPICFFPSAFAFTFRCFAIGVASESWNMIFESFSSVVGVLLAPDPVVD